MKYTLQVLIFINQKVVSYILQGRRNLRPTQILPNKNYMLDTKYLTFRRTFTVRGGPTNTKSITAAPSFME